MSLNALLLFLPCLYKICNSFTLTVNQVLLELAKNRNKIPLPKSISAPGIPLPPEQDTLISPNYQLSLPKKQSAQEAEEMEEDEESTELSASQEQATDLPQQTPQRVSFPLAKRTK